MNEAVVMYGFERVNNCSAIPPEFMFIEVFNAMQLHERGQIVLLHHFGDDIDVIGVLKSLDVLDYVLR